MYQPLGEGRLMTGNIKGLSKRERKKGDGSDDFTLPPYIRKLVELEQVSHAGLLQ